MRAEFCIGARTDSGRHCDQRRGSGRFGGGARIVRVEPRATTLRRSADDTDPVERVIVANAAGSVDAGREVIAECLQRVPAPTA